MCVLYQLYFLEKNAKNYPPHALSKFQIITPCFFAILFISVPSLDSWSHKSFYYGLCHYVFIYRPTLYWVLLEDKILGAAGLKGLTKQEHYV